MYFSLFNFGALTFVIRLVLLSSVSKIEPLQQEVREEVPDCR